MIEQDAVANLLDLAGSLPADSRVTLLDALGHLPLSDAAWKEAEPIAKGLLPELNDERTAAVLARVPVPSVRKALKRQAARDTLVGQRVALALATQGEATVVPLLTRAFRANPSPAVAAVLARVLQPGMGVEAEDLRAGLGADDEMTRFWTAIAMARVGWQGGDQPDLEPLEQVWDAFVRPADVAGHRPGRLLDRAPPLFDGSPAVAAARVAQAGPLPPKAREFVLKLKDHDFDGWNPRRPDVFPDTTAVRALVAGLTGAFDFEGQPIPRVVNFPPDSMSAAWSPVAVAVDELEQRLWRNGSLSIDRSDRALLRALDIETAGRLLERALRGAAGGRDGGADPFFSLEFGNEVLRLADAVPAGLELPIGEILADETLVAALPRSQLAWLLARSKPSVIIQEFVRAMGTGSAERRAEWIAWFRDIAVQVEAPPPYLGAGGGFERSEWIFDAPFGAGAEPPPDPLGMPEAAPARPQPVEGEASAPPSPPPTGLPEVAAGPEPWSPQPPNAAAFFFRLDGDRARRDAICAFSEATLKFLYDVPDVDALVVCGDAALDAARRNDHDIALYVSTRGNLKLKGPRSGVARFRHGRLDNAVEFQLAAGAAGSKAVVHVDFVVKGETVHQFDLELAIVADVAAMERHLAASDETGVPATLLSDAASARVAASHRVYVTLDADSDGLVIELTHWIDGKANDPLVFEASKIDRSGLETLLAGVRDDLATLYEGDAWRRFDGKVPDGDAARGVRAALKRAVGAVAAAGSSLYTKLREADAVAGDALAYIDRNVPDGAVLTVSTNDVFLPWEIVYPGNWSLNFTDRQKAEFPLDAGRFWGVRFAIETLHREGTGSLAELKQKQIDSSPKVSVNLNAGIAMEGLVDASQPLAVQRHWATALGTRGHLDSVQTECDDIRKLLQDAGSAATLIYVYCHGSAANPFGGTDEELQLDEDCKLSPADLASSKLFSGAPIVFLNSCQSAAHSPLVFSSFLRAFRRRGALGMIAASVPVPIVFGAHFGAEIVACYLQRNGPLSERLRQLRRTHLIEHGNPVPLFYTAQCEISFPAADAGIGGTG